MSTGAANSKEIQDDPGVIRSLIEEFFRRTFDIRRGEGKRVFLMWTYIFLVISSLLILKPVSFSLFLSRFGAISLPYAFILVSIFAALVVFGYAKLMGTMNFPKVVIKTLQIAILCLLGLWVLIRFNIWEGAALYVFYVWVAVFAVLSTSQFWILANLVFNNREAKRLFGFIGAGAIAGGIFGGYLTNLLAPLLSSESLLLICIFFLSLAIFIVRALGSGGQQEIQSPPRETAEGYKTNAFRLLSRSRHLLLLAGIVGVSVIAAKLVEYQFSAISVKAITDEDQLTAFFGFWMSNFNIVSLIIQLFLTRRLVGVFGVGTSLLFLPLGIFIGTVAVLIHPALWSVIFIKMCDGSLKQSINKAGIELMALPIPGEIKARVKAFIDVFIDSLATGLGGILLIVLTQVLALSTRLIGLVTILVVAGWLLMVKRIGKEYIHSFRLKIYNHRDTGDHLPQFPKESVLGGLDKALQGNQERMIIKTLKLIRELPDKNRRFIPSFHRLLHHPSAKVRLEVLRTIYYYKDPQFKVEVEKRLTDPDLEIRSEALRYLFQHSPDTRLEMMSNYLDHEEASIREAALLGAARESRTNPRYRTIFRLRERIEAGMKPLLPPTAEPGGESVEQRRHYALVIGAAGIPALYPLLHRLLQDPFAAVVQTAIQGSGESRAPEFIPLLVRFLGDKNLQITAREALQAFGPEVVTPLSSVMTDPRQDKKIRLAIPSIIAVIGSQQAVDILTRHLDCREPLLRNEIIRGLNRLQRDFPYLSFDEKHIVKQVLEEARLYVNMLAVLYTYTYTHRSVKPAAPRPKNTAAVEKARGNLVKTLEKRLDQNLERIFRLLGLKYPPDDIYNAYQGIRSNKPELRESAVEFLENVLESNLKKVIIPIIEGTMTETLINRAMKIFNLEPYSEFDCLLSLLSGSDSELQLGSLILVGRWGEKKFQPHLEVLLDDPDPLVQRTAQLVISRLK